MRKQYLKISASFFLVALALSLLTIGIKKEWRLVHEEDGAIYTTLALSHNYFGLRTTKFHDVFYEPKHNYWNNYSHHPPLSSILLALAFRVFESDAPWVVRIVPISTHLFNLALIVFFFRRRSSDWMALLIGFVWVTIPMGSYFGRIFSQSTLAIGPVLLQFVSYYEFKTSGDKRWGTLFFLSIFLGGLIDWNPIIVSAMYGLFELVDWFRFRKNTKFVAGLALAGLFITGFNLWHISYINNGNMELFYRALGENANRVQFSIWSFLGTILEFYRRYFTHLGFVASVLVAAALIRPSGVLYQKLFTPLKDPLLGRTLLISLLGSLVHIFAAPSYSKVHHYMYFYFMPYAVGSLYVIGLCIKRYWNHRAIRIAAIVFVLEFLVTSGYMLRLRHTKTLMYVNEKVHIMRRDFLLPCYLFGLPHTSANLVQVNKGIGQEE